MTTDAEREELRRLLSSGRPSTKSRFAPANAQPSNLEPAPTPSRLRQAASAAGKVGRLALSGKAFAAAVLPGVDEEDIEKLPGWAEFAVDNLVSPVGLASLALAAPTGGLSIAARLGVGGATLASKPLAVRAGIELGGRIASDLAISGVATQAAKGVEKALPDEMDPRLKTLASIGAGLLTGGATGVGLSKALKPAIKGTSSASALARNDYSLPRTRDLTEQALTMPVLSERTNNRVTRELLKGINPTRALRSNFAKLGAARYQQEEGLDKLAEIYVGAHFPDGFSKFNIKDGKALGNVPWRQAVLGEFEQLPESLKAESAGFRSAIEEAVKVRNASLPPTQVDKMINADELWQPTYTKTGKLIADPDTKWDDLRATAQELRLSKAELEDPRTMLHVYVKTAMKARIDKQFEEALKPSLRSADEILADTDEGKALKEAWENAQDALEQAKVRAAMIPRGTGRASKIGDIIPEGGSTGARGTGRLTVEDETLARLRADSAKAQNELFRAKNTAVPLGVDRLKLLESDSKKALAEYTKYRNSLKLAKGPASKGTDLPSASGMTAAQRAATKAISTQADTNTLRELRKTEIETRRAWQKYKRRTVVTEANAKIWGAAEQIVPVSRYKGMYLVDSEDALEEFNKWIQMQTRGGTPVPGFNTLQQAADATRFLQASLDASGPFINLLPTMFTNPKAWAKGFAGNWRALTFDPHLQQRYLQAHYNDIIEMANYGVAPGDIENYLANRVGGWAQKGLAGFGNKTAAKALSPARTAFGRAQSGYETGLLIARREVWDALKRDPAFQLADGTPNFHMMADHVRQTTGAWDSAYFGVGPNQRTLESIMFFSPRMFRSILALSAQAARPWTPEGAVAAHTILKMMGAGAGLFMVANAGIGVLQGKSEEEIAKDMEDAANPINGRQFLSVKVGDEWYGIGGQVRAMTQALSRAITNDDEKAGRDDNPFWDFFSGRLGPAARSGLQLGEVVTGNDWAPYERLEDFPDWIEAQAQGFLPFYIQNAVQEGGLPGLADPSMLVDVAGLSSKPRTSTDVLNSRAFERHNRPWKDLTGVEQDAILADHPELEQKSDDLLSNEDLAYNTAIDTTNTRTYDTLTAINNMNITQEEKRKRIEETLRDRWLANKTTAENFNRASGVGPADSPKRLVMDAYYNTFKEAGIGPEGTTQTDWDKWEDLQADLDLRIQAGDFGDPARAQQYIDERRKFKLPPELQWYEDAKEVVKGAQYWEQKDIAFAEIADIVKTLLPEVDSARELEQALDQAVMSGNVVEAKRINTYVKLLNNRTEQKRKLLKFRSPELKSALAALGR